MLVQRPSVYRSVCFRPLHYAACRLLLAEINNKARMCNKGVKKGVQ